MQGPNSDKKELARLSKALHKTETCEITTINYKKNGEEFWVNFTVSPVFDFDKDTVTEAEFETYWELLHVNNGEKTLQFFDNYMLESTKYAKKRVENLKNMDSNKYMIWGKNDEYDSPESYEIIKNKLDINSKNSFLLDECGYLPMVEKPTETIKIIKNSKIVA